jgi:hypothetical protein
MFSMRNIVRPGFIASAVLFLSLPAAAQQPPQPQPLVSPMPVPSELELSRLIWSTMAALDHANLSGNYSVLRDLSAPSFQANNDAARLTQIFSGVRQSRIDLSNALLLAPTYTAAPIMISPDVLRVQGLFGLRPTAVVFDFQYQWVAGRWRLFGISVGSQTIAAQMPGQPAQPQPQQPQPQRRPGGR